MAIGDHISVKQHVDFSCQIHKTKAPCFEDNSGKQELNGVTKARNLPFLQQWGNHPSNSDIKMENGDTIQYDIILKPMDLVKEPIGQSDGDITMVDRNREQQIMKQCNISAKDNDICDCINFKVNVQRKCHWKNTIKSCKMLQRPLNAGVMHYLGRVIRKYQPLLSGISSVFNYSNVKLHFELTFLLSFILLTVIPLSGANPITSEHGRKVRAADGSKNDYSPVEFDGSDFLMKFGYLPQSDVETGALRTKEEQVRSIKSFQRFAGIRVTGKFDNDTVKLMKAPRCGVADRFVTEYDDARSRRHHHGSSRRNKRYAHGPSKWDRKDITFRILNYTPDLSQHETIKSIQDAFKVWSQVTILDFREVYSSHADIYIKFARGYHSDGYPFDGPGLILAHAFFPGTDRGGDMHFDEDETWTYKSYEGTNLFSVAAHEIGHSLGLAHSSVPGSLMYPWYQGYTPNFQLHSDDISGIRYLYGVRDPPFQPEVPPSFTNPPTRGTRRPTDYPSTPAPTLRPPYNPNEPPYRTPDPPKVPTSNKPPDPCTTGIDAVSVIRSEVFLFKGKWFWRRDEHGIMPNYPYEIDRFWNGLPKDHNGIDAVYERPDDKIVFFKGKRFWVFAGNHLDNTPREGRPITELGFPADLEKIDAAFVWGYNGKTYLMSGDMYWKYNDHRGHMEPNYPRDIRNIWKGVPTPVDAVLVTGKTYFFKDKSYYEFHDGRMKVRKNPKHIAEDWLGCKTSSDGPSTDDDYDIDPRINDEEQTGNSKATKLYSGVTCYLVTIVMLISVLFR